MGEQKRKEIMQNILYGLKEPLFFLRLLVVFVLFVVFGVAVIGVGSVVEIRKV